MVCPCIPLHLSIASLWNVFLLGNVFDHEGGGHGPLTWVSCTLPTGAVVCHLGDHIVAHVPHALAESRAGRMEQSG